MSLSTPTTDQQLLEMLRTQGPMTVLQMAHIVGVTTTAIRQRVTRLLAEGLVDRQAIRSGRGRPSHRYFLTTLGLRQMGSNFTDLALALWRQIGQLDDAQLRHPLLRQVAQSLAAQYADQITGVTTGERMQSIIRLLEQRRVPFSIDRTNGLPVLTALGCPYQELAEEDRTICLLEEMLFSELLGEQVEISQCRLDGAASCRFRPT